MRLKKTAYRELHDLYSSWNIVRVGKIKEGNLDGTCGTYGGKQKIGRPRLRCQDNIEMNLTERELNGVGRIHLA
jgi:hypothetical protein